MLFAQLDKQLAHAFLRDVFSIKFYVDVKGKKPTSPKRWLEKSYFYEL